MHHRWSVGAAPFRTGRGRLSGTGRHRGSLTVRISAHPEKRNNTIAIRSSVLDGLQGASQKLISPSPALIYLEHTPTGEIPPRYGIKFAVQKIYRIFTGEQVPDIAGGLHAPRTDRVLVTDYAKKERKKTQPFQRIMFLYTANHQSNAAGLETMLPAVCSGSRKRSVTGLAETRFAMPLRISRAEQSLCRPPLLSATTCGQATARVGADFVMLVRQPA